MRLLRSGAIHRTLGFTDEPGALKVTLEHAGGATETVVLEPGGALDMPRFGAPDGWVTARGDAGPPPWLDRVSEPYWFEYLADERTVYMRFASVRNDPEQPLARFCERMFEFIEQNDVERLVIDMRLNGGGNNYLNQPLIHGLIGCKKLARTGALFVLTSPRTFSAAAACAGNIERETGALFVGEPTGAGPNHAGDVKRFTLPNSGAALRVSELWWQWSDPRDLRRAIQPDLPAPITFEDWRTGRDPAMEAVFAYSPSVDEELRAPNTNWQRSGQR